MKDTDDETKISAEDGEGFKLQAKNRVSLEGYENGANEQKVKSAVGSEDMDEHYKQYNLPTWEKHVMADFFMALASLESNMEYYERSQRTLVGKIIASHKHLFCSLFLFIYILIRSE